MNFFSRLFGQVKSATKTNSQKCHDLAFKMRDELGPVDKYMALILGMAAVIKEAEYRGGHQGWSILRKTGVDRTSSIDPVNARFMDLDHDNVDMETSRFCFNEAKRLQQHPATLSKGGHDVCTLASYGVEMVGYGFLYYVSPKISGDLSLSRISDYTENLWLVLGARNDAAYERLLDLQSEAEELGLGFADKIFLAWESQPVSAFVR